MQINVYFTADAKAAGKVNARFNGKRQTGDEGAGVVAFVVVQMGAAAVGAAAAQVVAGAVEYVLAVAAFFQHFAGGGHRFPGLQDF